MKKTYNRITWEEVSVGDDLPEHKRNITAQLVVGGAIAATRDYAPVHHDYHAAKEAKADDVFMNILTTNGLIGKYLTDWAGPTGKIKKIDLGLSVPNYPGDQMVMIGEVTDKFEKDGEYLVEVEYVGKNKIGNHATGKAVLALPRR
ncbi:hypothetical protein [Pueribacillus sp. YX66]|uniref:hypothetical protein n=1 Tax=Pueribacillus sp. YX66 TaxID=3229242 RepID=UPI00358D5EDD